MVRLWHVGIEDSRQGCLDWSSSQEQGFYNGSLGLSVNTPDDIIETSLELAHQRIHELKQRDPENSTFDQVGLLDGKEIALEYLRYGEVGTALT